MSNNKLVEKLYKLYNVTDKSDYVGSIEKCECTINGEYGLFKEKISLQSIDNVMEEVAYRLALLTGVKCAKARCRKHDNILGSFSRYEIPDGCQFMHLSKIFNADELFIDDLIDRSIKFSVKYNNNIHFRLFQYLVFDFILGQRDRHLENIAIIFKESYREKGATLYQLYDNGISCFATDSTDNSILFLNNRFYSSRIGSNYEIFDALSRYRKNVIKDYDIRRFVNYDNINYDSIYNIIDTSDKYKQVRKNRREAMVDFILYNTKLISSIN